MAPLINRFLLINALGHYEADDLIVTSREIARVTFEFLW